MQTFRVRPYEHQNKSKSESVRIFGGLNFTLICLAKVASCFRQSPCRSLEQCVGGLPPLAQISTRMWSDWGKLLSLQLERFCIQLSFLLTVRLGAYKTDLHAASNQAPWNCKANWHQL